MIVKIIFDVIFGFFGILIDLFDFDFINEAVSKLPKTSLPTVLVNSAHYITMFIDYDTATGLISAQLGWISFKLVWAIFLRIKSFIPTISST